MVTGRELDDLPEWVPIYLDAWGSKRPDGRVMTVTFAAGLAGVSPSTIRFWRGRSAAFRDLEDQARRGPMRRFFATWPPSRGLVGDDDDNELDPDGDPGKE